MRMTKGHDITEMFYSHHLTTERLEPFLAKYRVKETTRPRNVKLTFDENGFYMTLRRKVASKLPQIKKTTKIYSEVDQMNSFFQFSLAENLICHKFIISVLHRRFICSHPHYGHFDATISKHFNGNFVQFISHLDWNLCSQLLPSTRQLSNDILQFDFYELSRLACQSCIITSFISKLIT